MDIKLQSRKNEAVGQCGTHPCKERKDGAPSVVAMSREIKSGPPAQHLTNWAPSPTEGQFMGANKRRTRLHALWLLTIGCFICVSSGQVPRWRVLIQLPDDKWRIVHLDAQPLNEPDFEARPPILASLHAVNGDCIWAVGEGGIVVRTADGGHNWATSVVAKKAYLLTVFFIDSLNGWSAGNVEGQGGMVFGTHDGGEHWNVNTRIGDYENSVVNALHFVDSANGWAVARGERNGRTFGLILKMSPSGSEWKVQYSKQTENGFLDINFLDRSVGWAVGSKEIFHTEDGGRTWTQQYVATDGASESDAFFMKASFVSTKEGWIVGGMYSGRAWHTVDGGRTWRSVPLPQKERLPPGMEHLVVNSIKFVDADRGWIGGAEGLILSTKDGGRNWAVEQTGQSGAVRDITVLGDHVFVVTTKGVVLQADVGH